MMAVEVYDDMIVRRRLLRHCEMAGSEAAFARKHGLHETYVREALRGQAVLSVKLLAALGYVRVTRYVEFVPSASTVASCVNQKSQSITRR